jgi:hypothetical protein
MTKVKTHKRLLGQLEALLDESPEAVDVRVVGVEDGWGAQARSVH